jgi:hypothetical protein
MEQFQEILQLAAVRTARGADANIIFKRVSRKQSHAERTKYERRHKKSGGACWSPILPPSATLEKRVLAMETFSATFGSENEAKRVEKMLEIGLLSCNVPTHRIVNEVAKAEESADNRSRSVLFEELPYEDNLLLRDLERELNRRSDHNKKLHNDLERESLEALLDLRIEEPEEKKEESMEIRFGSRTTLDLWSLSSCGDVFALIHLLDLKYASHKDLNSADYRVPGGKSRTPLHVASFRGDPHVLYSLLVRAASVDQKDEDECTALDHAILNGHRKCVELLLAFGAECECTARPTRVGVRYMSCVDLIETCREWDRSPFCRTKIQDEKEEVINIKGEAKHRKIYLSVLKSRPRIGTVYVGTWKVKEGEESKSLGTDTGTAVGLRVPHTDDGDFGLLWNEEKF